MTKKIKSNCAYCNKAFEYNPKVTHGKYCNNNCQGKHRSEIYLEKLKDGSFVGQDKSRPSLYAHLVEQRGDFCEICGISSWNEKPIRLWVDHIDGNALNNIWNNLRLICPNCDSQLETCRAKNKGRGRKSLGIKAS